MLKKILLAALASLFTTFGMMLIYKSLQTPKRMKLKKLEFAQQVDTTLPQYQKALASIKTIEPRSIKQLPDEILYTLEREGCKIPVIEGSKNPQGWIKGHFLNDQQTDFAALCLTPQNEMTIKIAWGDKRPCSITIGYGMVQKYILPKGTDDFAFARILLKSPTERMDYFAYHNEQKRPAKGQEGIEDTLIGKGSLIYYCLEGKWVPLETSNAESSAGS
jgi:hypothetical protein